MVSALVWIQGKSAVILVFKIGPVQPPRLCIPIRKSVSFSSYSMSAPGSEVQVFASVVLFVQNCLGVSFGYNSLQLAWIKILDSILWTPLDCSPSKFVSHPIAVTALSSSELLINLWKISKGKIHTIILHWKICAFCPIRYLLERQAYGSSGITKHNTIF